MNLDPTRRGGRATVIPNCPVVGSDGAGRRNDNRSARVFVLRYSGNRVGSVVPDALEYPRRRGEYSLTENAPSPFQAEPAHITFDSWHDRRPSQIQVGA
jgi:hypothetical protein